MTIKDSQQLYTSDLYLKNNPSWHEEDAPKKAAIIEQLIKRNKIEIGSFCEVGCGSGEILVTLSKKFKEATFHGYDISENAIKIAKPKENSNIKFECKDISKNKIDLKHDLLLIIDVIEHIENYFAFLRDVRYLSKHTIFHIPLDMALWTLFREKMLIESKSRVGHIHNFTEDFILEILQDNGYKIVDKIYTEPMYNKTTLKQNVVELIRKILFRISKRLCSKTMGGISIMVLAENQHQH